MCTINSMNSLQLSCTHVSFSGSTLRSMFSIQNDPGCLCPGYTVTYQCSIVGGGTTVWQGTAFQCSGLNRHLSLRHSKFNVSVKPYGGCNNGAIIAHAIGVVDNHYTSQLNVTLSPEMNNRTVECVYDNGTETIVGSAVLAFTTGS